MPASASAPRDTFGRFRLLRKLATGLMAELFVATAPDSDELLVLKRVLFGGSADDADRFRDEVRLTSRLNHPKLVRRIDSGDVEGHPFLALGYLPGEDLATVLAETRARGEAIPVSLAAELISAAAEGLHAAHELRDERGASLNVVHRDVSPSNLILTYDGALAVVDFGSARSDEHHVKETAQTQLTGRPAYLSPEQARGAPVDRRSDVFALGAVLHQLLSGTRLFQRDSLVATLEAILDPEVLIPLPSSSRADVPRELDAVVMKALQRDPSHRHQSARELSQDLCEFLAARGAATAMPNYLTTLFGEERRQRKLSGLP